MTTVIEIDDRKIQLATARTGNLQRVANISSNEDDSTAFRQSFGQQVFEAAVAREQKDKTRIDLVFFGYEGLGFYDADSARFGRPSLRQLRIAVRFLLPCVEA